MPDLTAEMVQRGRGPSSEEAAVLVVETNPIDGALLTFMVQDLTAVR